MPSALETLVKILKLEQGTDYKNTAVIGGLESFAEHWKQDAHQQAKRPEHHQLVDELVLHMQRYPKLERVEERHDSITYMLGRITGRIPAPPDLPPSTYTPSDDNAQTSSRPAAPPPAPASQVIDEADDQDAETNDEAENDEELYAPTESLAPRAVSQRSAGPPRRASRPALNPDEIASRVNDLQSPVTALPRVGDKMEEKLQKLGIHTVADMLFTFPRRYDDYSRMRTLNHLVPGETVTVIAAVRSVAKRQGRGGRPYLLVTMDDGTGLLQVAFFGQPWLQRQFKRGSQIVLSGTVELFRGQIIMTNPEWELLERENLHTGRIVPVYTLTKGLSARTMRRLMHHVVEWWSSRIPDHLPESVLDRTELADLGWALQQTHFPDSPEWLDYARRRLSFDEIFLFQMKMLAQRHAWQSVPGQPLPVSEEWLGEFTSRLPYTLTAAQQRAVEDILGDMRREVPMNRLLQGDVGSGKTVVAAIALAAAAQHGKQAALMAPTSILAEQHARSINNLLNLTSAGDTITLRLLTGNTSDAERQEIYTGLADGSIQVVIGTHALIQQGVEFNDLALAIVDEQHRFGVEQRGILRSKGTHPHMLVMTATPIPRTLALTLYADLDLSIIDEMPPGRTPVETKVLRSVERERAYSFIRAQLDLGRQAFIIYPLVESSEQLEDVGAAVDEFERLSAAMFRHYSVGLLHGRMSPAEKDSVMSAFAAGDIQVLVSTSVIEVGIDVPNASVILIENAERFGLAQLHQLRGRVGRGEHKSFCLLIAGKSSSEAEQRLRAMEDTTDGFKLAEIDWELRGPGDLLGVRQSGSTLFRLADAMNPRLVELAQREARTVFAEDPSLSQPEHQLLAKRVQAQQSFGADVS